MIQWLGSGLSLQGGRAQFLVRELRSRMPRGRAKKKKREREKGLEGNSSEAEQVERGQLKQTNISKGTVCH